MSRTKAIIGICLVFFLGIITGVAISARFVQKQVHRVLEGGPSMIHAVIIRKLGHDLNLDGNQRDQIQKILEDTSVQMRDARQEIKPKLDAIRTDAITKVRAT